jgi:hypothetical protein
MNEERENGAEWQKREKRDENKEVQFLFYLFLHSRANSSVLIL